MGLIMRSLVFLIILLTTVSCANTHCRRKMEVDQAVSPAGMEASKPASGQSTILVYKYDGSLQCQSGKAISLEQMAGDLKGITIFSQQKKPDGLMHIQVCGAGTGMANVFEILEQSLPEAEKRGFKKWSFR